MGESIYFILHGDGGCELSVQKNLFYFQPERITNSLKTFAGKVFRYLPESQCYQSFTSSKDKILYL